MFSLRIPPHTFSWLLAWFMTLFGAALIFFPHWFAPEILVTFQPDPERYGFSLLTLGLGHYLMLLFESSHLILSIRRLLHWASSILIAVIGWQLLLAGPQQVNLAGIPFIVLAAIAVTLTIIHIPGTLLDHLQEQTRDHHKLNQLLNRLKAILESTEEALIAVDKYGKIILFNAAASRLTGYSADQATDQTPSELLRLADADLRPLTQLQNPLMEALHTGVTITTPPNQNYYITNAQHHQIPINLTASPVTDITKQVIGAVCTIRDITIEKRLQQLQNEFVFIAAHELRNPVTAITGFLEMALDTHPRSPRIHTALAAIEQANLRLIKLVNNLLQVARTESDKLKPTSTRVNFNNILNIVVNLHRHELRQKRLNVNIKLAPLPPHNSVYADPNFLQEILSNLLSNAIKYTPSGSITITQQLSSSPNVSNTEPYTLLVRRSLGEGGTPKPSFLITHITDTGIGIPQSEHPKLFEKFYRASNIGDVEGNGLGMFIVKQLIEKMDGAIWFVSQENHGSTFSFSIPLASEHHQNLNHKNKSSL